MFITVVLKGPKNFEVGNPRCVFKLQYKVDNLFKRQLFYSLANNSK